MVHGLTRTCLGACSGLGAKDPNVTKDVASLNRSGPRKDRLAAG